MSWWGTLDAEFKGGKVNTVASVGDVPTGSEDGPNVRDPREGIIDVSGRLRDVTDLEDSPRVLAWFVKHAQWADEASLTWELDGGPRYRYEWRDGELRKLRGVLDL